MISIIYYLMRYLKGPLVVTYIYIYIYIIFYLQEIIQLTTGCLLIDKLFCVIYKKGKKQNKNRVKTVVGFAKLTP